MTIELFGAAGCPWTAEARAWLDDRGVEFVEHDVESDPVARDRLLALLGGPGLVPAILEDGRTTVGWRGRGCLVAIAANTTAGGAGTT